LLLVVGGEELVSVVSSVVGSNPTWAMTEHVFFIKLVIQVRDNVEPWLLATHVDCLDPNLLPSIS
jgi:hypothetical protein